MKLLFYFLLFILCFACSSEESKKEIPQISELEFGKEEFGKVLIENEKVKVYNFSSLPGRDVCGFSKHQHKEHLTVFISGANVTVTDAEGKTNEYYFKSGTVIWSPEEEHMVVNSGEYPINIKIIETIN